MGGNHQRRSREWKGVEQGYQAMPFEDPYIRGIIEGIVGKLTRSGLRMIRPIATEIGLFLIPFVLYAAFLLATRAGILHPNAWTLPRLTGLVIASLILMIGSLIALVQFGRPPPGAIYVPAHTENGKFVPQTYR